MRRKIYNLAENERELIKLKLKRILKSHGEIEFAFLYGSFLERMPFRDLDIGIYVQNMDKNSVTNYAIGLAAELSAELKIPVDIRAINFAPLTFIFHVLRGQLLFSINDDLLAKIMEETMQKYLDLKPILYRTTKEAFAS